MLTVMKPGPIALCTPCPHHPEITIPELEPRTFSFNSPQGACPVCTGLGSRLEVDPELVIPNGNLTIAEGAIRPYNRINIDNWYMKKLQAVAEAHGFSLHVPTGQLSEAQLKLVMYGTGDEKYRVALGMVAALRQPMKVWSQILSDAIKKLTVILYVGILNDLCKKNRVMPVKADA